MSGSTPQHYRCPTCGDASVNPRHLTVFIDGTSNRPGPKETNVMKLYNARTSEGPTRYFEGIGAAEIEHLPLWSYVDSAIYSAGEKAVAWNVEKNVKEAYDWLVDKYQEGDQICLFGFSRGAYQVRALAGMVHEVGLLREKSAEQIDQAYRYYLAIDPKNPKTREAATKFKRDFCRRGVRVHFIGVWDTVSSLGFVKQDVHITASASVTNACHFRHALALDERRVKFMPEYFMEMNAHHTNIRTPRSAESDVKEVWFPGCHSDVGGTSRPSVEWANIGMGDEHNAVHAGNVSLSWMVDEAISQGLGFDSERVTWNPVDVDLGRADSMSKKWRFLEYLPIRHQVSFSGTGKHSGRLHRARPRLIIPNQQIHFSVLSSDAYTPCATLGAHVDIPTQPRSATGGLWATDEEGKTHLLTSLLSDPQKTIESVECVFFLLDSRLSSGVTQAIPTTDLLVSIDQRGLDERLVLTVIHYVVSNSSTSEELVRDARNVLITLLRSPQDASFPRAVYVLRFLTNHQALRQRFIAQNEVTGALSDALKQITESNNESLFPLVVNSLHCLIRDNPQQEAINQLTTILDASRLLAKRERGPVGTAAIEALVALKVPLTNDVRFTNILGYLCNTLLRLDAEGDSTSSHAVTLGSALVPHVDGGTSPSPGHAVPLPPVFRITDSGEVDEKDMVMCKLLQTIESRDAQERTAATLTLLKLCKYSIIRNFCSRNKALDIFVKQLERKKTSLLAAYALNTCLKLKMWTLDDLPRLPKNLQNMLEKGWFDDAIGRVEGPQIFRELVASGESVTSHLRQKLIDDGTVSVLVKSLENGGHHEVRMSLICLEILAEGRSLKEDPLGLTAHVEKSLEYLRGKGPKTQKRGIKVLSALARTVAGEQAITPYLSKIVNMLVPAADGSPPSRSQLFAVTATLYDLCRNETLREQIKDSPDFLRFRRLLQRQPALYPKVGVGR